MSRAPPLRPGPRHILTQEARPWPRHHGGGSGVPCWLGMPLLLRFVIWVLLSAGIMALLHKFIQYHTR